MRKAERIRRDFDIVFAWLRGLTYRRISQVYGISERQVKRIVAKHREEQGTVDHWAEALDRVDAEFEHLDAAIADLALIRLNTNSDAIRIKAITHQTQLMQRRVDLLLAIGALPRKPRPVLDAPAGLPDIVWDYCRKHGLSVRDSEELLDALLAWAQRDWGELHPRGDDIAA
ncbi:MAG TPA: hypothetical protein VJT75_08935 [Thermoleophilaceae bacterium]|nr:hypothetical protein [Thermoleophilaceae bacterium]